jgi:hypothetical protein
MRDGVDILACRPQWWQQHHRCGGRANQNRHGARQPSLDSSDLFQILMKGRCPHLNHHRPSSPSIMTRQHGDAYDAIWAAVLPTLGHDGRGTGVPRHASTPLPLPSKRGHAPGESTSQAAHKHGLRQRTLFGYSRLRPARGVGEVLRGGEPGTAVLCPACVAVPAAGRGRFTGWPDGQGAPPGGC